MDRIYNSPMRHRPRPVSEVFIQSPFRNANDEQQIDAAAEKWLADLQLYQQTLEQMAEASLDKNFKDELSAIEQWFEVLSVAERTAALYALLQQSTPVQIRFFITVLQKIGNRDPLSSVLSPTSERNFSGHSMFPNTSSSSSYHPHNTSSSYYDAYHSPNLGPSIGSYRNPQKDDGTSYSGSSVTNPSAGAGSGSGNAYLSTSRYSGHWGNDIARPKSASSQSMHQQHQQHARTGSGMNRRHMKSQSVLEDFHFGPGADHLLDAGNSNGNTAAMGGSRGTPGLNWSGSSPVPPYLSTTPDVIGSGSRPMSSINAAMASGTSPRPVSALERDMSNLNFGTPGPTERKTSSNAMRPSTGSPSANTIATSNMPSASAAWSSTSTRPSVNAPSSPSPTNCQNIENVSPKKEVVVDKRLLKDVGLWLRTLRLHKYTENLKNLSWQQLIELDDKELENRGINALGARRKMLKVFEQVKTAVAHGDLDLN